MSPLLPNFYLSERQIKESLGVIPIPSTDFAAVGIKTIHSELDLIITTLYNAQFGISAVYGVDSKRVNHYVDMAKKCCQRLRIDPSNIIACVVEPKALKLKAQETAIDLSLSSDWTAEIIVEKLPAGYTITDIKQIGGAE